MPKYIDGFVLIVPKGKAEEYKKMANTLANYSRTSGIQVVTIHPETVGQTKDVNEVHTEIVEELDIFCEQKRYTSPV